MPFNILCKKKNWESENLNTNLWELVFTDSVNKILSNSVEFVKDAEACLQSSIKNGLCELNLPSDLISLVPQFEKNGFVLADSRINFRTEIDFTDATGIDSKLPSNYEIRWGASADIEQVLFLNKSLLIDNVLFSNRYKNEDFFSKDTCERYYQKWIHNTFNNENSLIAVVSSAQKIVGFFIYLKQHDSEGNVELKGILTGVSPEHRGHNLHLVMQDFIFKNCGLSKAFIINSTQLSNFSIIQNHILSKRRLSGIYLVLMKKVISA